MTKLSSVLMLAGATGLAASAIPASAQTQTGASSTYDQLSAKVQDIYAITSPGPVVDVKRSGSVITSTFYVGPMAGQIVSINTANDTGTVTFIGDARPTLNFRLVAATPGSYEISRASYKTQDTRVSDADCYVSKDSDAWRNEQPIGKIDYSISCKTSFAGRAAMIISPDASSAYLSNEHGMVGAVDRKTGEMSATTLRSSYSIKF